MASSSRNPNKVPRNWKDAKALDHLSGWDQFAELGPVRLLDGDPHAVLQATTRITNDVKPLILSLDCSNIESSKNFHIAAKKNLRFPDYYGMNWNAFDDCVRTYDFVEESHIVVMFSGFKAFLDHARWEALMVLKVCQSGPETAPGYGDKKIVYVFVDR